MIQWMLAIWSLVPLPFLKPDLTSGSSRFTYYWCSLKNDRMISVSTAFSTSNLNIWKFSVHVLLKPGLENFEHYFASVWDECSCSAAWAFFGIAFGIGMKIDLFHFCGHCWVFQIFWHVECSTLIASSFRILNSPAFWLLLLFSQVMSNSVTPWTAARQAPLSMGFSRQEYWSGLPCPSPGDLPNPGIKPRSHALQADSLPSEPPGKP